MIFDIKTVIEKRKNSIAFVFILMLQLPFIIQWQHYLNTEHIEYKHHKSENLIQKNLSSCFYLHKIPYGFFQKSNFFFSNKIIDLETIHLVPETKGKINLYTPPFSLRAPPVFFSI